jgi:type I restriction enzyme S subunit
METLQIRPLNLTELGTMTLDGTKAVECSASQTSKYSLLPSDVLFNNTNSPELVGKVAIFRESGRFVFSNHITRIRVRRDRLLPEFLHRFLFKAWSDGFFQHHCTQWINQAAINVDALAKVTVPVPALVDQERIVKLLNEADELGKLRAQADRRTADLIPALFHEMFGDPSNNPRGWKFAAISEMAEVQGGLQVTSRRGTYPQRRPYLRVANVQRGFLILDEMKEIGLLDSEYDRVKLAKGDLLLVEGNGNPREVGRAAIWDGSIEDCVHQNHLIRVRPIGKLLTSDYLLAFVNSESGRSYFHGSGNTTSGLVTISTSIVKNCRIPLPPLVLQKEFAVRASEVLAMQAEQAISRRRLEDLFKAMLHRAFNGEL